MVTTVFKQTARWPQYVASAYLRRIRSNTTDFNPGKGSRIYRRYAYTIDAVRNLNEKPHRTMH
jgi:hypothetical protein